VRQRSKAHERFLVPTAHERFAPRREQDAQLDARVIFDPLDEALKSSAISGELDGRFLPLGKGAVPAIVVATGKRPR